MQKYCTKCGAELKQNNKYCSSCGSEIDYKLCNKKDYTTSGIIIWMSIVAIVLGILFKNDNLSGFGGLVFLLFLFVWLGAPVKKK